MKLIISFKILLRNLLKILCVLLFIILLIVLSINVYTIFSTQKQILTIQELNESKSQYEKYTILVLGAGIINPETPSRILAERLDKVVDINEILSQNPIIVSGDHSDIYYDEVSVMKNYLTDRGLKSNQIYKDHAGYSTYESLYRAQSIIGEKQLIIITQAYHLHRSLLIANELGIEAVGISANEINSTRLKREIREIAARIKDWAFLKLDMGNLNPEDNYAFRVDGYGDKTNNKEDLYKIVVDE